MLTKKLVPSLFLLLIPLFFISGSAFADTVNLEFSFTGNGTQSGGVWSWGGGSSTLSASFLTSASLGSDTITNSKVGFVSGPGTGGSGTLQDPFMFGPSGPNSILINGCVTVGGSQTCGVLFTGSFQLGEAAIAGSGSTVDFTGSDVTGTLNAALAASLNVDPTVTGSLVSVFDGDISMNGGMGYTASGNLALQATTAGGPPTPEPGSLLLLGTGLLGLSVYVRNRIRS